MALTLPQQLEQRDVARMRAYQENLSFYSGSHWPGSARRRERRLTFNYVRRRTFVHKATAALLAGMHVAVEPLDASPEAVARAASARRVLLDVAEGNDLQELDFETELDAAVLGDGCYKVTWESAAMGPGVRVTSQDVQGLFAWWVGDDVAKVWRVASRYRLTGEETEFLYGVTPSGPEAVVVEAWTAESMGLWVDNALLEERPNPYGFIPYVVFPNLREPKQFWGSADITPLMEPQREINRAFSQLSAILELSGNPIAVLEGVEEAQDIAVQPGRSGRCRNAPAPICSICCRVAASGCTRSTSSCSTGCCTTSRRPREPLSATAVVTSPASPWKWSSTRWCSGSPASGSCATPCTVSGRRWRFAFTSSARASHAGRCAFERLGAPPCRRTATGLCSRRSGWSTPACRAG